MDARHRSSAWGRVALEVVAGVAVGVGLVAALDVIAPITGLSVVLLLVVLALAIRRGQAAGLAAAVLGVLALNFFFIEPLYQLTIADSGNVVALVVFLVAAIVVGRLAEVARARARESESRARDATAREREAELLAGVARRLLSGGPIARQLGWIGDEVAAALGAPAARLELTSVPSAREGERTLRLPLQGQPGWLYVAGGADGARLVAPLASLIDVARERERVGARAAAAEATRRADAAKTAVLHAISHDLRSPLTAITTAADALAQSGTSPEDGRELVGVVRDEAARLARLVDDLLDLSRIEAGAVNPQRDWVDLREVVARSLEQIRAAHPEPGVTVELPAELPLVRADASQLERIFTNLLENAVKFSPPACPVRVTGGAGGGRVTVRFIDRGPGVPRSQRAAVFEPFFRGRPASGGAGLGLAIARGFAEANGATIALQSPTEGETAFAVGLPLESSPRLTSA